MRTDDKPVAHVGPEIRDPLPGAEDKVALTVE